ncbi:MAG: dihydrolipoyl dehydrogenase family protein [Armatimonadota bacterium]
MESFDVVVVGGGTAGPSAARVAKSRGFSVCVIERDRFGGDCLWWACVPTKTLIACGKIYQQTQQAARFGTRVQHIELDYHQVQSRKDAVIAHFAEHDDPKHLEKAGIRVIHNHASFRSQHELQVGDTVIRAEHIVLAIGSQPMIPPIPGLDEVKYLTNIEAISLPELPKSMLIMGGGAVGCEFALLFQRFGVPVTLIEADERVLFREDQETSMLTAEILTREGVTIHTGANVKQAAQRNGDIVLTMEQDAQTQEVTGASLLVATGRITHTEDLNLDAAGVATTKRGFVVRDTLQTNVPHIWACGDAAGKMLFTHVAENQGHFVGMCLGLEHDIRWDGRVVPRATFLEPEIASVGLTEAQAAKNYALAIGKVPFSASDRAVIQGETTGFVKIIADKMDGQILGAHIVGPRAGDLIHEIALAMKTHTAVSEIGETIHLYPSLLDPLRWAAQEAAGQMLHLTMARAA